MKKILFALFAVFGFSCILHTGETRRNIVEEQSLYNGKRQRVSEEACLAQLCSEFVYCTYEQTQDPYVDLKEAIKDAFLKVVCGAGALGLHSEAYEVAEKTGYGLYDAKFMKTYVASTSLQLARKKIEEMSVCTDACSSHNQKNE